MDGCWWWWWWWGGWWACDVVRMMMNLWWLLKVWSSGWITSARSVLAFSIFLENFADIAFVSCSHISWYHNGGRFHYDLPVIDGGAANVAEVKSAKPFQSDQPDFGGEENRWGQIEPKVNFSMISWLIILTLYCIRKGPVVVCIFFAFLVLFL